ncbi:MAG: TonB-dependent receptor [Pseudomonadales bacterium]
MATSRSTFSRTQLASAVALASSASLYAPLSSAADAMTLEEVIVTARKIDESLQDVPVAVSAFSGKTIDDLVMRDIRETEGFIPNLVIDAVSVSPAGASIYIRGVGTQEVERSFDPAVGVVVDGVPLSFVNGSMSNTFDFEAFEVLRGPQGTLFGRNTTGGVINITRTKPTGEPGLKYELTGGSDSRIDVKAVANFPIVKDVLAGKLGFSSQKNGGQRSNSLTGERVGDADNQELNATLLWTPSDDVEVLFTYVSYEDKNDGVGLQNITSVNGAAVNPINPGPETPCVLPEVVFGVTCGDAVTDIESFTQDYYNPIDFQWDSFSLSMNWDIGPGTITAIFGHQETEEIVKTDFDATSLNFFHADRLQDSEQTSVEIRFASNDDFSDRWNFVAGIFWLTDDYQLEQRTSIAAFGGPGGAIFQNPFADHERDAWAVFGEANITLSDKLNLTVGGRFTEEEKQFQSRTSFGGAAFAGFLPDGGNDLYVFGTPIFVPISSAAGKEDWREFSPKIGLDYRINDDVLTYISYSEGFRSGGFNGRNTSPEDIGPFDPEFVDNIEIGMKGDFLDDRLRLNLAAFYADYNDKQEEIIEPDGFGGSNTVVRNASTVDLSGLEGELTWVASDNFRLSANIGLLEADYAEYIADLNGDGTATDNSNLELRRVPSITGGINGLFSANVGAGTVTAFVGYRYTDEYWVEVSNDPRGLLDSRGVWDATLSYEFDWSNNRIMKITAFGRDLTDEVGFSSAVTIPGTIAFAGVAGGRQFGLQISGNF